MTFYQEMIPLKGTSHSTVIAIQVPRRLHNIEKDGDWIHKPNTEEVWISMNGKGKITLKDWVKIKEKIDKAFENLDSNRKV